MSITRQPVARYRAGESFTCTKRHLLNVDGDLSEPCGATIVMHGYWWCMQVCPKCLANYYVSGSDNRLYPDFAGFYPAETAALVRQAIASNGGQYIPTF